jgi:hypothetical protein
VVRSRYAFRRRNARLAGANRGQFSPTAVPGETPTCRKLLAGYTQPACTGVRRGWFGTKRSEVQILSPRLENRVFEGRLLRKVAALYTGIHFE